MALGTFIKGLQNIMRKDSGVDGDAQRLSQIAWMLFLKVYDSREEAWEFLDPAYKSIIPEPCRWRNWAVDKKDGKAMTGDDLLFFVNTVLFPTLKKIEITEKTPMKKAIVKLVMEDMSNYMKDGTLLRQVVNEIDSVDFGDYKEQHAFNEIYEALLKSLQSAGNAGEFYTPRAVTDFIIQMVSPRLGEKVADFACGTGGFLVSSIKALEPQVKTVGDREKLQSSIYGCEWKALPHLLCVTNLLLHGLDEPNILHGDSLSKNVREYGDEDKFDVIVMNPPYGGSTASSVLGNFPADMQTAETADLFMVLILYRLKQMGRVGVVLSDGFMCGTDGAEYNIKEKLFAECNVHTIIRLPHSVFAPYTSITTNLLFFDKTGPTKETWFYRLDMPEGYKNFSKTKPMKLEHFAPATSWWNAREEIIDTEGFPKAKRYSIDELKAGKFNLDLCGFPHEVLEILEPKELLANYQAKKAEADERITNILSEIVSVLEKR